MPSNNPSPIPAFMAQLNLRDYSGLELFWRQGAVNTTTFPTFDTEAGEGLYEDWLDVLNGRGSQNVRSLGDEVTANKTIPANSAITVGIDENDRVYVEGATRQLTVYGHTNNIYGFSLTGDTDASGPPYRSVASGEWLRGLIFEGATIGILPTTGGYARFSVPPTAQTFQSVVTKIREVGSVNDADDPSNTGTVLETIDNNENNNVGRNFRWWMNDSGHIGWSCVQSLVASASPITWVNTSFRDLLGFSGNETVLNDGSNNYQIADYPAKACLVPTRPIERITRSVDKVDAAVRLVNGRVVGNLAGAYQSVALTFWVDGPVDSVDLHRHWLERVVPYLQRGARVSWYGEWGDPRRGLLGYNVTESQPAYDLLYTSEVNGERGRYRGRVAVDAEGRVTVEWPEPMRRRAPATLVLEKAED